MRGGGGGGTLCERFSLEEDWFVESSLEIFRGGNGGGIEGRTIDPFPIRSKLLVEGDFLRESIASINSTFEMCLPCFIFNVIR